MTTTNRPSAKPSASGVRTYQWYADGEWRDAPAVFDDFEPYSGNVYAHAPNCGADEAQVAIAAASAICSPTAGISVHEL